MRCIKIPSEDFIFIGEKIESMANKYIFRPSNTSLSAMRILSYASSKKSITAKEIIHLSGKTKSNITQRLNILERDGFIKRIKNLKNQDKREVFIKITTKGKKKVEEIKSQLKKFEISKDKCFTKKELSDHIKFMHKLNDFLNQKEELLKNIFNQK